MMKKVLWFFKYGAAKQGTYDRDWHGDYGLWPKRGFTFNESCGPVNFCFFWWPHLFGYCAIRWFGTWYRLSFNWSNP